MRLNRILGKLNSKKKAKTKKNYGKGITKTVGDRSKKLASNFAPQKVVKGAFKSIGRQFASEVPEIAAIGASLNDFLKDVKKNSIEKQKTPDPGKPTSSPVPSAGPDTTPILKQILSAVMAVNASVEKLKPIENQGFEQIKTGLSTLVDINGKSLSLMRDQIKSDKFSAQKEAAMLQPVQKEQVEKEKEQKENPFLKWLPLILSSIVGVGTTIAAAIVGMVPAIVGAIGSTLGVLGSGAAAVAGGLGVRSLMKGSTPSPVKMQPRDPKTGRFVTEKKFKQINRAEKFKKVVGSKPAKMIQKVGSGLARIATSTAGVAATGGLLLDQVAGDGAIRKGITEAISEKSVGAGVSKFSDTLQKSNKERGRKLRNFILGDNTKEKATELKNIPTTVDLKNRLVKPKDTELTKAQNIVERQKVINNYEMNKGTGTSGSRGGGTVVNAPTTNVQNTTVTTNPILTRNPSGLVISRIGHITY